MSEGVQSASEANYFHYTGYLAKHTCSQRTQESKVCCFVNELILSDKHTCEDSGKHATTTTTHLLTSLSLRRQ